MKQIGRMTLYEVIELADKLMEIRIQCLQSLDSVSDWHKKRHTKTIDAMKGDRLSIAKTLKLIQLWRNTVYHYSVKSDEKRLAIFRFLDSYSLRKDILRKDD